MKTLLQTSVLLSVFAFLASSACYAGESGGSAPTVVGHGSSPGDGSGNCGGYGDDDPYLVRAKQFADQNAANQCAKHIATRIGDYQVEYKCGVWNAYFAVSAEAEYECH